MPGVPDGSVTSLPYYFREEMILNSLEFQTDFCLIDNRWVVMNYIFVKLTNSRLSLVVVVFVSLLSRGL
jgi:hypothetical protein